MHEREEYVKEAVSRLNKLDVMIAQLETESNQANPSVQQDNVELIGDIKKKREVLDNELQQLAHTSLESWDKVKTGFEVALKDIDRESKIIKDNLQKSEMTH